MRIASSPELPAGFLKSRLATLATRYPRLDIDLAPNLRSIGLERYEADIAIRFDRPKDGDVVARPLTTVGYRFYGTDDTCRSVEVGADPVFIGFSEADACLSPEIWMARHFPRAPVVFRAKDQFAHSVAARSSAGLALLSHYIDRSDPLLRFCVLGFVPSSKDVFLLNRRRDRKETSIRIVTDEVVGLFEQAHELFLQFFGFHWRPASIEWPWWNFVRPLPSGAWCAGAVRRSSVGIPTPARRADEPGDVLVPSRLEPSRRLGFRAF